MQSEISKAETHAVMNTDRELWREPTNEVGMEYYQPSIHVTERGGVGINVGGTVFVKSLRDWHALASVGEPAAWRTSIFEQLPNGKLTRLILDVSEVTTEPGADWTPLYASPVSAGVSVTGEDGITDAMVERAARVLAGEFLEHAFEGDAESEWWRIADITRRALEAARIRSALAASPPPAVPFDIEALENVIYALRWSDFPGTKKYKRKSLNAEGCEDLAKVLDELLRAMLSAAPRVDGTAGEWQDISTAPKDGTVIDLFGARNGKPQRFPDGKWVQEVFGGNHIDKWSWAHRGWDIYGTFEYTHWRPLPPNPPKTGEGK